jgi:superfamily II DNA or RNA helicase
VKPEIKVIRTEFNAQFYPTRQMNGYVRRNNYTAIMKRLQRDDRRNATIIRAIMQERGHSCLVVTDRLEHIDTLAKMAAARGWPADRIFKFTGKQSRKQRKEIIEQVQQDRESLMFSTIAREALDIPPLDRLFLVWPMRNPRGIEQYLGRVRRTSPGKKDAVVYDFLDNNVSVLRSQFSTRQMELYSEEDLNVDFIHV